MFLVVYFLKIVKFMVSFQMSETHNFFSGFDITLTFQFFSEKKKWYLCL